MTSTSIEFLCKCGKQRGWISDGEETLFPCPECGRKYEGKYNPKTLTIDAIQVSREKVDD